MINTKIVLVLSIIDSTESRVQQAKTQVFPRIAFSFMHEIGRVQNRRIPENHAIQDKKEIRLRLPEARRYNETYVRRIVASQFNLCFT